MDRVTITFLTDCLQQLEPHLPLRLLREIILVSLVSGQFNQTFTRNADIPPLEEINSPWLTACPSNFHPHGSQGLSPLSVCCAAPVKWVKCGDI